MRVDRTKHDDQVGGSGSASVRRTPPRGVGSDFGSLQIGRPPSAFSCFLSWLWTFSPWGQQEWIAPFENRNFDDLSNYDRLLQLRELCHAVHKQWSCSVEPDRLRKVVSRLINKLPDELQPNGSIKEVQDSVVGLVIDVDQIDLRSHEAQGEIESVLQLFPSYHLRGLEQAMKKEHSLAPKLLIFRDEVLTLETFEYDRDFDAHIIELFNRVFSSRECDSLYWVIGNRDKDEGKRLFKENPRSEDVRQRLATAGFNVAGSPDRAR